MPPCRRVIAMAAVLAACEASDDESESGEGEAEAEGGGGKGEAAEGESEGESEGEAEGAGKEGEEGPPTPDCDEVTDAGAQPCPAEPPEPGTAGCHLPRGAVCRYPEPPCERLCSCTRPECGWQCELGNGPIEQCGGYPDCRDKGCSEEDRCSACACAAGERWLCVAPSGVCPDC